MLNLLLKRRFKNSLSLSPITTRSERVLNDRLPNRSLHVHPLFTTTCPTLRPSSGAAFVLGIATAPYEQHTRCLGRGMDCCCRCRRPTVNKGSADIIDIIHAPRIRRAQETVLQSEQGSTACPTGRIQSPTLGGSVRYIPTYITQSYTMTQ